MKKIYFVRHGQSQANVDGIYAGSRIDSPLTQQGLAQAELLAKVLQGKKFDLVLVSPLQRGKKTAEKIAQSVGYKGEVVIVPLLTERDFGLASGKTWAEVDKQIDNGTAKELETTDDLAERMKKVLEIFRSAPGESILVVGHGTAEMMLQTIYQGRTPKDFLQTAELGNAEFREYTF